MLVCEETLLLEVLMETLAEMLKVAHQIKDEYKISDELIRKDVHNLDRMFESILNRLLFKKRLIRSEAFLCSRYIAVLLSKIASSTPKSWYAVDYFIEGHEERNPWVFRDGADTCFILCSLYRERCDRRSVNLKQYMTMGTSLYYQHYIETETEISYYMAILFETMSELTKLSMSSMRRF
jgi:hypothetical protein